ncbi:hypothetical protein [Aquibium microcysteis]|uniref:hypothetical protein n=1 Tax=Aquibium microcysteis TaxID=675281 RepID=UPI00165CF6FA|nr:hypothetical protein [Aquibium microcysteis]
MTITAESVVFFLTIMGFLSGIWWRIEGLVKEAKREATLKADAAGTKADLVSAQLAEYKTHVAETYVSKAGLREFRDEMSAGFKDIKTSIGAMNERMDRVIEASHKPQRRTSA